MALASPSSGLNIARRFLGTGAPRLLGLLVLLAMLGLRYEDPAPLERLRLALFDAYFNLHPRSAPPGGNGPVVIVDIDEASLRRFGQWPFSRALLARAVDAAREGGAAAIGFDIVFPEPDRLSPSRIAENVADLPEAIRAELKVKPDTDARFAAAIEAGKVVLGRTGLNEDRKGGFSGAGMRGFAEAREPALPLATLGGDPLPLLPAYPALLRNIEMLEAAAAGIGIFSIIPEPDGIIRRVPLAFAEGGKLRPALSLEILRIATGGGALVVKRDEAGISGFAVGGHAIPTERDGRRWVYYSRHDPARFVSIADLLDGKLPAGRLEGKIVLFGASAIGLQDLRATPLERAMPGVEIHAQMLETILSGESLDRPHLALGAEVLAAALLGLVMIALVPLLGAMPALSLGALLGAATLFVGWHLFVSRGLLIDTAFPLLSGFAVFLTLAFSNYWREERRRHEIRTAFQHYLAPSLVEKLAREPHLLRLGGETRELTILFSDLRGFTAVAESMSEDPQALTHLMNRLLSPLSAAIMAEGGTIDKYMGDAVMAFWNAPLDESDHAACAARAALAMRRALDALEAERRAEAAAEGKPFLPLEIGIGINTGMAVVGNMGSEFRFDYTALGDAVNLAQRLEGLTQRYGVPILIGEATAARLEGRFGLAEIDAVQVKGKSEAARVFTLGGAKLP